jgi:hypothetical protein
MHPHSPRWAGVVLHGVVRQWARAHDVCMNSPPKSNIKSHRFANSFCRLFLPCHESVSNIF